MSLPRHEIKPFLYRFFTSLLLTAGTVLPILHTLSPGMNVTYTVLICCGMCLVWEFFAVLEIEHKWLFLGGLILIGLIFGVFGIGPFHHLLQCVKAAILSLCGVTGAVQLYAGTLRVFLCCFFALLYCIEVWDGSFFNAAIIVLGEFIYLFVLNYRYDLLLYLLPACAGLILMLVWKKDFRFSVLPFAVLIPLTAFLLVPSSRNVDPKLSAFATSIREYFEDYLLFNNTRSSFSLADAGYEPLQTRLGGPVTPDNTPVMEVRTDEPVLLRARTYNTYSGLYWYDNLTSKRYIYNSTRYAHLRQTLFDQNRPLAAQVVPSDKTVEIHLLNDATTTLYVPQRIRGFEMLSSRMVPYFSDASEIYLTRNLQKGDRYTVTYTPFKAGDPATKNIIAECENLYDADYKSISEIYLALPSIQSEIYDITDTAIAASQSAYDKACAIAYYLNTHYTYTLTPEEPLGYEFVAEFMLGSGEGYCTYFASACTIMCRIAGIPARYVTGYFAVPDAGGIAMVTGEHAHAWTEVYLNGFGWLPIDPTNWTDYGDNGENGGKNGDHENDRNDGPSNEPTPTPTPDPSSLFLNNPLLLVTPTPEPTPEPEADQDDNSPDATPAPGGPETTENDERNKNLLWLLFILLPLLLVLRWWLTRPANKAKRKPDQSAYIYYDAITQLLQPLRIVRAPAETLMDFGMRADNSLKSKGLPPVSGITDAYQRRVYSNHASGDALFKEYFDLLYQSADLSVRIRFTLRQMLPSCMHRTLV